MEIGKHAFQRSKHSFQRSKLRHTHTQTHLEKRRKEGNVKAHIQI